MTLFKLTIANIKCTFAIGKRFLGVLFPFAFDDGIRSDEF